LPDSSLERLTQPMLIKQWYGSVNGGCRFPQDGGNLRNRLF
jgi:hypothetical protein